jgi:hypothetical protein
VKKTKGKFEYSFTPSKEYIRETCDLPAEAKLAWLEEANKFVYESVPKSRRKDWQKYLRER